MILELAVIAAGTWAFRRLVHAAILRGLRAPRLVHGQGSQEQGIAAELVREVRISGPRCPTLLVHGRNDNTVPVGDAHRLLAVSPRARLLLVDGDHDLCGSLSPYAQLLVDFLRFACSPCSTMSQGQSLDIAYRVQPDEMQASLPDLKEPMIHEISPSPRVDDELEILAELVPLGGQKIIELGCGAAQLARALLARHPGSRVTGLEVDARQHAKNLAAPQAGLEFVAAGAQAIPGADARFDLALMLKSLHHVPMPLMTQALDEVARVLRPGGHLYVSEPVYGGPFNEVVRVFNDERVVRAAAQSALDAALRSGRWAQQAERRFEMPVRFADFTDFDQRMMRPTFADHGIDDAKLAEVRAAFEPHIGPDGAQFNRPMHVRLLRRLG